MDFICTDRDSIESGIIVRSAYVVVSIHDPQAPPAKVRKQAGLRDVLYVAFNDAEPSDQMTLPPAIKLMTLGQAKEIWRFVRQHKAGVGAIVCQCEQGMSRSPGIAAALCKAMGGDDMRFWREYQPNVYVFRLVLQAAEGKAG